MTQKLMSREARTVPFAILTPSTRVLCHLRMSAIAAAIVEVFMIRGGAIRCHSGGECSAAVLLLRSMLLLYVRTYSLTQGFHGCQEALFCRGIKTIISRKNTRKTQNWTLDLCVCCL